MDGERYFAKNPLARCAIAFFTLHSEPLKMKDIYVLRHSFEDSHRIARQNESWVIVNKR